MWPASVSTSAARRAFLAVGMGRGDQSINKSGGHDEFAACQSIGIEFTTRGAGGDPGIHQQATKAIADRFRYLIASIVADCSSDWLNVVQNAIAKFSPGSDAYHRFFTPLSMW